MHLVISSIRYQTYWVTLNPVRIKHNDVANEVPHPTNVHYLILLFINNYSMHMRASLSSSCPKCFVLQAHKPIYNMVVYCIPTPDIRLDWIYSVYIFGEAFYLYPIISDNKRQRGISGPRYQTY